MKRAMLLVIAAVVCSPGVLVGGDKGTVVDLDGLKSTTPTNWKEEKPDPKSLVKRMAQFRLPHADGDPADAELALFQFEKASGGVDANLDRWKKKFTTAEGKPVDNAKVDKFKVGNAPVTYLDISGTYKLQTGPDKYDRKPDYRMLGVIFEGPDHTYYLTVIGPAKTIEQHKKGFDEWIKGFK